MNRFWKSVVRPTLDALSPKVIVEIGAEAGAHTKKLLEFISGRDAVLHVIDPEPSFDVDAWSAEHGDRLVFHREKSLNALPHIEAVDAALIDGDHNWYTVTHELKLLEKRSAAAGRPFPVVMLHDVDWPYGRRDLYYDPDGIPEAFRQPFERRGITPHSAELVSDGGVNAHLSNSIYEHDLRNGVRTAIEDFSSESDVEIKATYIPGLHGLGILVPEDTLKANKALAREITKFRSARFLRDRCDLVEEQRVSLKAHSDTMAGKLVAAEEQARALDVGRTQLEADVRAREQKLEQERARLEKLDRGLSESRSELEAARGELEQSETERKRLDAETTERGQALHRAEQETAALAHALADREQELGQRTSQVQSTERERELAERELEEVRAEQTRLAAELEAAQRSLEQEQARMSGVEGELSMAREELERRREEAPDPEPEQKRAERELRSASDAANAGRTRVDAERSAAPPEPVPPAVPPPERPSSEDNPEAALRWDFHRRYGAIAGDDGLGGMSATLPIDHRGLLVSGDDPRPEGGVSADVVVCVHNALEDVRRCLWSLVARGSHPFRLILVNDGSDEATSAYLAAVAERHPSVTLIENPDPPHGYCLAANLGMRESTGDYVVLLNSDTVVTYGWLERVIACGESDERIGVLGPLSNAASHQSVPDTRDEEGWATNPLPRSLTPDGMAFIVARAADAASPRFPFINGFCYVIKRKTIEQIGYFDEDNFAAGYCEENDFSFRALQAGHELAVVDDAYVYHAKSKSYGGAEGRRPVAKEHYSRFLKKHGEEEISKLVDRLEADESLSGLRKRIGAATGDQEGLAESFRSLVPEPLSVTFVLPGMAKGSGGGVHSIYQEVAGMRSLGIPATIALHERSWQRAVDAYGENMGQFVSFASDEELLERTRESDVVVATHHKSIRTLEWLRERRSDFLPAYYVQDYEPFFSEDRSADADEAVLSYGAIGDQVNFAKTHWLCNLVGAIHGLHVSKVEPSIDHTIYHPRGRVPPHPERPVRFVGMVRPRTQRRQPLGTVRLLDRLKREFGERVEVLTFGCGPKDFDALTGKSFDSEIQHCGLLTREQVGALLRSADAFLDFSIYQAFGRTALESMACGCTCIAPRVGGAHEFAVAEENALLVDTSDDEETYAAMCSLVEDQERLRGLQARALETAERYSVARAALSEYVLFEHEHSLRIGDSRPAAPPVRA